MAIGLDIVVEEDGGKCILRLDGRIDATTSATLERELSHLFETGHRKLLLDFVKVDYLSSAGMRVFLSASKKMKANQGFILFYNLNDDVMDIIRIAGFERILRIYPNEHEALKVEE
ncbi:MAG: STAS domain-containing protein [Rhabdochlamydiaceae bacterium]|nr:STAS domain-containing protein [Rhabdochlamydiaceae bacterium]